MSSLSSAVQTVLPPEEALDVEAGDVLQAVPVIVLPAIPELLAYARHSLRQVGEGKTALVTVPAPAREPEALLRAAGRQASVLWAPPTGPVFAGIGCAHRIEVEGRQRIPQLRHEAEHLWPRLEVHAHPATTAPRPRLFGGLAFEAGWARDEAWSAFGDGCFTLPRLLYRRDGETASLTLAVERTTSGGEEPAALAELRQALEALAAPALPAAALETAMPAVTGVHPMPAAPWASYIEAIREGIRDGRFAKVVAAGRAEVELGRPLETADVLARLAEQIRTTRFAFFRPGAVFLGASPERLVSRTGRRVETEALAGSIAAGRHQAARLLDSPKDHDEHTIVVRHIVERLAPLCRHLEWSDRPQVRELLNVLHLATPIRGELRQDLGGPEGDGHVLDLVRLLHPTPAVGGVPAQESIRWIVEHETAERGWYSGPVGWFDAAGDGEFAVALRSCVLAGRRAFVYAGAGIVRDSDPHLEYLETELKQKAILAALGVGG